MTIIRKPKATKWKAEKRIDLSIYDTEVVTYLADDWQEYFKVIVRKEDFEDAFPDLSSFTNDTNALTYKKDHVYYLVGPSNITPGTLTHECLHIVLKIAEDTELSTDANSSEALCYLMGYIVKMITKDKK